MNPDDAPGYAELHCLSNFSFLRGASHPAELVTRAQALGYRALALTDECSLAGAVRAYEAARALPPAPGGRLKLIIGAWSSQRYRDLGVKHVANLLGNNGDKAGHVGCLGQCAR